MSAYVRAGDVLMSVDVETTRVEASACASAARPRYRVRTWLGQQVLGEDQFEL